MNNERYNQIIEEVGRKYTKWWYDNAIPSSNGKPKLDGEGILTRGEFINKIKTDDEFAKTWGLKIQKRELSGEERWELLRKRVGDDIFNTWVSEIVPFGGGLSEYLQSYNTPTKLITITYNNETIESYE